MQPPGDTLEMRGWRACDACGDRPLAAPAEGLLSVDVALLEARRAEVAALAAGDPEPGLVPWHWGHRDCFPRHDPALAIAGDRLDTLAKVMARTLQLLDADWFLETAWEDAVRRFYRVPAE